jgi:hypothetical protein
MLPNRHNNYSPNLQTIGIDLHCNTRILTVIRISICITIILFTGVSCDDVLNDTSGRDELARRAMCRHNMIELGQAIAMYKAETRKWPTSLSLVDLRPLPRCPSASVDVRVPSLDGIYVWDSVNHILSEDLRNHDPKLLRAPSISNWVGTVIFVKDQPVMVSGAGVSPHL